MSMWQTGTINLDSTNPTETTGGNLATFTAVTFPTPFPASSNVVVIPMVQTFNGPNTPGVRIAEVTNTGFLIRMNELHTPGGPLSDGVHAKETIGWVAFTA